MAKQYRTIDPDKYLKDYMAHGIRQDCREFSSFRPISINVGSIMTADGSAIVKIGNTTAVCGIKAELTQPKAETPDKGFLIVNVELPPLCSSKFRPGPPSDQAQVTTRLVADIIENSRCIKLKELCIKEQKLAWVLYCDIICLDLDGSLTDACVLSLIAAMRTVRLPEVEYDPEIDRKTIAALNKMPLNVYAYPVATTFAIFDNSVVVADPTSEEENLCVGIVTVVVKDEKELCSVHKPGGKALTKDQMLECVKLGTERSVFILQLLESVLKK